MCSISTFKNNEEVYIILFYSMSHAIMLSIFRSVLLVLLNKDTYVVSYGFIVFDIIITIYICIYMYWYALLIFNSISIFILVRYLRNINLP